MHTLLSTTRHYIPNERGRNSANHLEQSKRSAPVGSLAVSDSKLIVAVRKLPL